MGERVVGTCSICGSAVRKNVGPWFGVDAPLAHCTSCGAHEAPAELPIFPMQESKREEEVIADWTYHPVRDSSGKKIK